MTDDALAAALTISPGQVIGGRYLVGDVLGGGGMGVVCAGTHVLLGTPVAIKLIHSDLKHDEEAVQRFMNEARAAAALKGEHIARVFDVGLLGSGEPYLVMEQLEGTGLDQYLLECGPLGQTEAVDIVLQACEGLAEAHAAGLVHRDIKPANLFLMRLPNGQFSLKILDFGIAKQRLDQDTPGLTNPGKSLGSPWYMSPEQMLTPASVDQRADVWSLGVLLFELLTAKRPFDGETVPQVCATVLTAPAPRPSELRDDVAPGLDQLVLGCLEKEPERRFASVSELARALIPFASAPSHASGLALEASAMVRDLPSDQPSTGSYGTLTPLAAGSGWPPKAPSWPRWLALAAAPLLVLGAWLVFRQRPLVALASLPEASIEATRDVPSLLQTLHDAQAVPEPEREPAIAAAPVEALSVAQRRARYEAWLHEQGLTRIPETSTQLDEPPSETQPE